MPERGKIFKDVLISSPKRSYFDMSFDNTFTCNMGKCVPTICKELLPSDFIKMKSSAFMRFMPMVSPAMGKVNLFSYHFIVRNRDIWTEWDKFITNVDQKKTWQQNQSFVPPEMPYIDISDVLKNFYLTTDPIQGARLQSTKNCYYYCVGCYRQQKYFSFITCELPYFVSEVDILQVYAFVPNRGDLFTGKMGQYSANCFPNLKYYNPFGAGSLFDFLGVNIDGFYDVEFEQLFSENGLVRTTWPTFSPTTDLPKMMPWEYRNQATIDEIASYADILPDNIRIFDSDEAFFRTHFILGFASHSDQNAFACSWYVDGKFGQSGTPAVTIRWTDAPLSDDNINDYDFKLSALPLRAYRFIYDEYFRDQNYIEVNTNTDFSRSGNDLDFVHQSLDTIWNYLNFEAKAFEHDPYTTALPGPQKGDPVRFLQDSKLKFGDEPIPTSPDSKYGSVYGFTGEGMSAISTSTLPNQISTADSVYPIEVDMSSATIENFRWANAMQRFLERKARTGGRYYEYLLGIWNSDVSDAKLNRPIYLGGQRTPVQIGEITQTSSTNMQTGQPLGDLAGRGVAVGRDKSISFHMPDFGFLFEISVVVPRTAYGQGIDQKFKRFNYMDYPIPDFAQIGEEAVRKMELYATLKKSIDESAFGWQSRYYYWKYNRDEVHSSMLTDMKHWNFARIFDSVPYAGKDFLEVNPSYRQFAVVDDSFDHCVVTMWHDITINRALPEFGTPIL